MNKQEFEIFIEEIIPQQLFHVESGDIDDQSGGKLEEVILISLIYNNLECLKHKPLKWFLQTYL